MNNLRKKYTKQDRRNAQVLIQDMRDYIIRAKKSIKGELRCEGCGAKKNDWELELHERIYNPAITIYDIKLLCLKCHKQKHPAVNVMHFNSGYRKVYIERRLIIS